MFQNKTVENDTFSTYFVDISPGNYDISVGHYNNKHGIIFKFWGNGLYSYIIVIVLHYDMLDTFFL